MDEADITNFSTSSSSHRLPTVSASAALEEAASRESSPVSTGLPTLDELLLPSEGYENASHVRGGLPRGVVTEIYGPPGSGKTALAMQMASNALHEDLSVQVYWVDTGSPIPAARLKQILSFQPSTNSGEPPSSPPEGPAAVRTGQDPTMFLRRFHHIHLFTLPHLLALLLHSVPNFPPPSTSLLVIDNISSLFSTAFPSYTFNSTHRTVSTAARKSAMTSSISSALSKLARLHNIAILVVNQTATTAKSASNAGRSGRLSLRPSLGGKEWDPGIGNRCLVYREFVTQMLFPGNSKDGRKSCRWIEVIKGGRRWEDGRRRVAFGINDDGVYQLTLANSQTVWPATATAGIPNTRIVVTAVINPAPDPVLAETGTINSAVAQTPPRQKRKRRASDLEIADSQSSSSASSGNNELPRQPNELLHPSEGKGEAKEDEDGDDEYGSFLIGEEDFDFDFEGDVAIDDDDDVVADEGDERGDPRMREVARGEDGGES